MFKLALAAGAMLFALCLEASAADLAIRSNSNCMILGDSIALGSAEAVRECSRDAKIGISSTAIIGRAHDAALVVISAGSNDPKNPRLPQNLEAIRANATHRVLWIVPIDKTAAEAVKRVAAKRGDGLIFFAPAKDNVHPRSYGPIASQIRMELKAIKTGGRVDTAPPAEPKAAAAPVVKKPGLVSRFKAWVQKHRHVKPAQ